MPFFKSLVWLDLEKCPGRKRESNPGFAALKADALNARPKGQSHASDLKMQEPGVLGSVPQNAGPESAYCDWMR